MEKKEKKRSVRRKKGRSKKRKKRREKRRERRKGREKKRGESGAEITWNRRSKKSIQFDDIKSEQVKSGYVITLSLSIIVFSL